MPAQEARTAPGIKSVKTKKPSTVTKYGSLVVQNGERLPLYFDARDLPDRTIDVVPSPDGEPWGTVPDCLVPYPSTNEVQAGVIVVPVGDIGSGLEHVRRKHARKIADLHHGMSLEEYLQSALRHYQEIYLQSDGSLVLLRSNGIRKCAVVAPVSLGGVLVYKLITAYPLPRKPDYERRNAAKLKLK